MSGLRATAQFWLCTHVDTRADHLGVRELRGDLAGAVRRASAGQRTIVTQHGHPVAQLAPLDEAAPGLDHLVAAGALVPPRRVTVWRAPEPVPIWSGTRIDRALRDIRG